MPLWGILAIVGLIVLAGGKAAGGIMRGAKYINHDSPFEDEINYAAGLYRVPDYLIRAHIMTESSFNADAENPDDPSYGLMGITPGVAHDFAGRDCDPDEIKDPATNIQMGAWYISQNSARFGMDTDKQIAAYNEGPGNVNKGYPDTPYVEKVRGYEEQYKNS